MSYVLETPALPGLSPKSGCFSPDCVPGTTVPGKSDVFDANLSSIGDLGAFSTDVSAGDHCANDDAQVRTSLSRTQVFGDKLSAIEVRPRHGSCQFTSPRHVFLCRSSSVDRQASGSHTLPSDDIVAPLSNLVVVGAQVRTPQSQTFASVLTLDFR